MPRKPNTKTQGYNEIFPARLRGLFSDHPEITQQHAAEYIGLSRQMISQYCNGGASPDWKTLSKLCQFFNVSADYLLGLTDTPRIEANARAAVEYTGLSPAAVETLNKAREPLSLFLDDCPFLEKQTFLDRFLSKGMSTVFWLTKFEFDLYQAAYAKFKCLILPPHEQQLHNGVSWEEWNGVYLYRVSIKIQELFGGFVDELAQEHAEKWKRIYNGERVDNGNNETDSEREIDRSV